MNLATARADLCARREPRMSIQKSARHRRRVFHLRPEHSHTSITNRTRKVAVSGHTFNVEVLNADDAEFSRYAMTELMDGILPNISNPFVKLGKFGFRFPKVCAALGLSGQRLVKATKAFS